MSTTDRRVGTTRRGMTLLGKIPAAPKPINLPSQRLENQGLVSDVAIVPRGTFSWGSAGRPASVDQKPAQINKNEDVVLPDNVSYSNAEGGCLAGKSTQCVDAKRNASPPSSAGSSRSDVTSNMSSNSESWDNGVRVHPRSISGSESGGSVENVKTKTLSDSGRESVNVGLDNDAKLDDPMEPCPFSHGYTDGASHQCAHHQHDHVPDPQSNLNNDGGARVNSKPPPGFGYSPDSYSNLPSFNGANIPATSTQNLPYGPGSYPRQDSCYNMNGMPFYSGAKSREIVVIHMYGGDPGFYGGYFPHPGFPEHYSRPIMYTQFPLQFGQFENFVFPGQGMLDNGSHQSTPVNAHFFGKQPEFSHGIHNGWTQGNSMNKDLDSGEVESEAFEIKPHFSKFNASNKAGRRKNSNWNNRGVYAKSSSVTPLSERRVTLLTKVSRHEVIINSLHAESRENGVESVKSMDSLALAPFVNNDQDEKHVIVESAITDKMDDVTNSLEAVDEPKILMNEVDLQEDNASRNMEDPVAMESSSEGLSLEETMQSAQLEKAKFGLSLLTADKPAGSTMSEDIYSCMMSSSLVAARNDEHFTDVSGDSCQTFLSDSRLDNHHDDKKEKDALDSNSCYHTSDVKFPVKAGKFSEMKQCSDEPKNIHVQNEDSENNFEQSNLKGPNVKRGKDKKHEYKQMTRKSRLGRRLFVPKIQRAAENSRTEQCLNSVADAREKENADGWVEKLDPSKSNGQYVQSKKQEHNQSETKTNPSFVPKVESVAEISEMEDLTSNSANNIAPKENVVERCVKQWRVRGIHGKHGISDKQEMKQSMTIQGQLVIAKTEMVVENLEIDKHGISDKQEVKQSMTKQSLLVVPKTETVVENSEINNHDIGDKQEVKQSMTKQSQLVIPKAETFENSEFEQCSDTSMNGIEPKGNVVERCAKQWRIRKTSAQQAESDKQVYKRFATRSKSGCKLFVPKIQTTIDNSKIEQHLVMTTKSNDEKERVPNSEIGQNEDVIDREASLEERGAEHGKSKKREYKRYVAKSKTESKMYISKFQKSDETIDVDSKGSLEIQSTLIETDRPQAVIQLNDDTALVKPDKETCVSDTTDPGTQKLMGTAMSPKNCKSIAVNDVHSSKSSFSVPDGRSKNMKWKKVQKNGSMSNGMIVWHHAKHQQKAWNKVTA